MKTWIILLLILLAGLQCDLWLSSGGIASVLHLKEALDTQASKNQALMERNHLLEIQVNELKQGQEALEDQARSELGMISRDEEFYQIIDSDESANNANKLKK